VDPSFITLSDCFIAYRKAKAEAYHENAHMQAMAFAEYEKDLSVNLRSLLRDICSHEHAWAQDAGRLGTYIYTPKGECLHRGEVAAVSGAPAGVRYSLPA
jgi:hypothetical protein